MDNLLSDFSSYEALNRGIAQLVAMGLTVFILPGLRVSSIFGAISILIAITIVNATIWDAALFFSMAGSLSVLTLQVFIANGLIFWVLVKLLPGIEVSGFLSAFLAPIIFTVMSSVLRIYAPELDWIKLISEGLEWVSSFKDDLKTKDVP